VIERVRDNLISTFRVSDESKLGPRLRNAVGAWRPTAVRWLKFNAVGALGIAVQLVVLLGLKTGLHLSYLLATAFAVEAAVVHNFLWHERYTWADRVQPSWRRSLPRLLRFNLTTGGVSIAGNLALMKVMVGLGHLNYLVANSVAIALCSLVNFLVSDRAVFAMSPDTRRASCDPIRGGR
jgi:putative flippase GtrA